MAAGAIIILIAVCAAMIVANESRKRIFIQRPSDDPFEDAPGDWPHCDEIIFHNPLNTSGGQRNHG